MADTTLFIDLHAHFPMHSPFPPMPFENPLEVWKKPLFDSLNALLNFEDGKPRVSLERWFKDDPAYRVSGFGSVLYDPQDEILVATGVKPIPEAFRHLCCQWTNVEKELSEGRVVVARNPKDVDSYLKDCRPFVFHALEGGFSLGGHPSNVAALAKLGVAYLTPAHLLPRGVATCENAFPPEAAWLFKGELDHQPAFGLWPLGRSVVEECFKQGVIVDITHARSDAQDEIFDIACGYPKRPLISSHNSLRTINPAGLNLSPKAVDRIKASNGVIGVILYTQWLRRDKNDPRDDLQLITDVIDGIHDLTKSYDHIAIGSDLDGFIEPIASVPDYSKMSVLSKYLRSRYGELVSEKILYRNALRVLEHGWTGVTGVPQEPYPCPPRSE